MIMRNHCTITYKLHPCHGCSVCLRVNLMNILVKYVYAWSLTIRRNNLESRVNSYMIQPCWPPIYGADFFVRLLWSGTAMDIGKGHLTPEVYTWIATKSVPAHLRKSLKLIWRLGTRILIYHTRSPHEQWLDKKWRYTRNVVPKNDHQTTRPINIIDIYWEPTLWKTPCWQSKIWNYEPSNYCVPNINKNLFCMRSTIHWK